MEIQWNSSEEIRKKTQSGVIRWFWPIAMLLSRTILFFAFGFAIQLILAVFNVDSPNVEVTRWWTYQVIGSNILCFLLLRWLAAKEGMRFRDLIGMEKRSSKKDVLLVVALLIPSGIIGYFSVYLAGVWLYGDTPPAFMFQTLPLWAAVLSVIVFPLTNALVETPTYLGYSFPRIAVISENRWLALILASSFLALQHIGIPLYLDLRYMLWRFLSFLPFAFFAGWIYLKIRRLLPLMVLHYFADLPLAIVTLVMTIQSVS